MHILCPCHSGKTYETCCKKYHDGALAPNAMLLMRSRYAAYALHLADYIIRTTHPKNPQYNSNTQEWVKEILIFSQNTDFLDLKILGFTESSHNAVVTFAAYLRQHNVNASFKEKSMFEKVGDAWYYREGRITPVEEAIN